MQQRFNEGTLLVSLADEAPVHLSNTADAFLQAHKVHQAVLACFFGE